MRYFTGDNDRIKLLILLCGEEDVALIKAALGALAILSFLQTNMDDFKDVELDEEDKKKFNEYIEENRIICEKIVEVRRFRFMERARETIDENFRSNHLRKYLNIYVHRLIWNYNFVHSIFYAMLSKPIRN